MSVAALQETKWFGDEMYEVEYSVVLTFGRPLELIAVCWFQNSR